jgi:hypothetical protein
MERLGILTAEWLDIELERAIHRVQVQRLFALTRAQHGQTRIVEGAAPSLLEFVVGHCVTS